MNGRMDYIDLVKLHYKSHECENAGSWWLAPRADKQPCLPLHFLRNQKAFPLLIQMETFTLITQSGTPNG